VLARAPLGLGLVATDQAVPFQCSTSVLTVEPTTSCPTALQFVALGHEIPTSSLDVAPLGLGLVISDQLVAFQRSINVRVPGADGGRSLPTAKQLVAVGHATALQLVVVGHETPRSVLDEEPLGMGFVITDQFVPFQCSAICASSPWLPTAKQLVAVGHDTAASWPSAGPGGVGLGTTDHIGSAVADADAKRSTAITRGAEAASRPRHERREDRVRADSRYVMEVLNDPIAQESSSSYTNGRDPKSMRITTRRTVGLLTSLNPAAAKTLRLPTWSSPHVISCPGRVIIG
jgi:hypothetical protein